MKTFTILNINDHFHYTVTYYSVSTSIHTNKKKNVSNREVSKINTYI